MRHREEIRHLLSTMSDSSVMDETAQTIRAMEEIIPSTLDVDIQFAECADYLELLDRELFARTVGPQY